MSEYEFYYDESEHSRKINYRTVSACNYYDNFITVILGWKNDNSEILYRHTLFESKYDDRKNCNGEIKSTMIPKKQFKNGFASLNKQNTQFLNDFLSIFDDNVHIYFSVSSKIEHIILQLFQDCRDVFPDYIRWMKYSIIKSIVLYQPKKLIKCIYDSPENFLNELKHFFKERIEYNKKNLLLKKSETKMFQSILLILNSISTSIKIDWDYHMPFQGFKKYLNETNITRYTLIIDKEGDGQTLKAARQVGLCHSFEGESTHYNGIRIADMMAGLISKLLKGLSDSLRYKNWEEAIHKKILDIGWFQLTEEQLDLYKKLYRLICYWNPAWYKAYSGIYSDDLIVFIALLNFMNQFDSVSQIQENITKQGEYFNALACENLSKYFNRR